jgi:hypothetical protein
MTTKTPENTQDPNDFSNFDDLALFSGIQSEAETARQEQQERENRVPLSYTDEGSYWLRIYPEIRAEEDGSRRMHVMRKFWSYTGLCKGVRRLPAPAGDDDRVRPEVQRLKDAKYAEAWKFQAKEEGLIKVNIFRSSLPKDHKYIKINTPMVLVLRRKQINALNEFLADLSPENLRQILDPRNEAPLIKMSFTAGAGGSSSFGFDLTKAALPPLPENFPSIFDILLNKDTPLATDEELHKIRKAVSTILAMSSNIVNPESDSGSTPPSTTAADKKAAAQAAVKALLNEGGDAPSEPAKDEPKDKKKEANPEPTCPSSDPNLSFGHHNPEHVDCITCPYEAECSKASQINM